MQAVSPRAFVRLLSDFQSVRYTNIAGWALITYDFILTFPSEVNLFWGKKWTYARVLFTINRYYIHVPQAMLLSDAAAKFCGAVFRGVAVAEACIQLAIIEAIICLRLSSICSHYKYIKFVYAFAFASTVSAICVFAVSAAGGTVNVVAGPGISICQPTSDDVFLFCTFIPVMGLDVIACYLAVHRYRSHMKLVHAVVGDTYGSQLLFCFVRDSILYFVSVLTLEIVQVIVWKLAPASQHQLLCSLLAGMWCTLGNRLLLNPRELNGELLGKSSAANTISVSASMPFGSAQSRRIGGSHLQSSSTSTVIGEGKVGVDALIPSDA